MNRGYSLLEAVIGLALITAVIYGASNAFLGRGPKHRLHKAAWEVQTRLNYARHKAVFEGRPFRVRFQPAGYIVEGYDPTEGSWRPAASGVCEGVSIAANNSPTFHPAGTVSNMATITIANSAGTCRITLAISGRVRVVML
jgi:hypothetical protein